MDVRQRNPISIFPLLPDTKEKKKINRIFFFFCLKLGVYSEGEIFGDQDIFNENKFRQGQVVCQSERGELILVTKGLIKYLVNSDQNSTELMKQRLRTKEQLLLELGARNSQVLEEKRSFLADSQGKYLEDAKRAKKFPKLNLTKSH